MITSTWNAAQPYRGFPGNILKCVLAAVWKSDRFLHSVNGCGGVCDDKPRSFIELRDEQKPICHGGTSASRALVATVAAHVVSRRHEKRNLMVSLVQHQDVAVVMIISLCEVQSHL